MGYMYLEKNSIIKKCKKGFSWTILFFGEFPLLFRGMYKDFLIVFLLRWIITGILVFIASIGSLGSMIIGAALAEVSQKEAGISMELFTMILMILLTIVVVRIADIYYIFKGNKLYIKKLLLEGYAIQKTDRK